MAMATRRCGHGRTLILYLKNAGRGPCGGRRAVAGANDFDVIRLCSHSLVLDSTIRLSGMRQMTKLVTSICQKHAQYSGKQGRKFSQPGKNHLAGPCPESPFMVCTVGGLVKFAPSVAYHLCLYFPTTFSQQSQPCTQSYGSVNSSFTFRH